MLLFFMFDWIETSIRLFPRKKSVATIFVSFHHSSWNLIVRLRLTESAICRSPPDRLKKMSNGNGVSSAITAHNGFWLFLGLFGPRITSSKYLNRPSTVCWLPHTCVKGGHNQSYSKLKRIKRECKIDRYWKGWKLKGFTALKLQMDKEALSLILIKICGSFNNLQLGLRTEINIDFGETDVR